MNYVRKVRPAIAFPFVLGVFSGSLISVFLFLAVRSIDDLDRESLPGMEAREEGVKRNLDVLARENGPGSRGTASESERNVVFLPRQTVSFNVLVSMETRGWAIEKTWGGGMKLKDRIDFYLLPSAQVKKEMFSELKKKAQIIPLGTNDDSELISDDSYQGVFDLWTDICKRKSRNYHWFARLKDNVYLQADKLESLLSSLNSSKPILIGRSVTPVGYRRDELGLRSGESYCFEGGYAVSWKTLELVCPYLPDCQLEAKSENEDVEMARCIRKHTGINCTTNTEVRELFYVAEGLIAEEELQMSTYHHNAKIKESVLLSPLSEADHFYHLHRYFMKEKLNSTKAVTARLRAHMIDTAEREARLDNLLYTSEHQSPPWSRLGINPPFSPQDPQDGMIHFQSFDDQFKYSESKHHPNTSYNSVTKREMYEVQRAVEEFRNQRETKGDKNSEEKDEGNSVTVESILQRIDPTRGIDYFLQLNDQSSHEGGQLRTDFYHILRELEPPRVTSMLSPNCATIKVNFVVATPPVSRGFQRFMLSFENSFLSRNPPELVSLLVILYSDGQFKKYDKDLFSVVTLLDLYRKKYPEADLRLITTRRPYSRKETVEIASKEYPNYELLFLADIHVDFSMQFVERCRMNAVENQQVYFPMIFSPYDPAEFHKSRILFPYATKFKISEKNGAWMPESFHLVCVFNYDLMKVLNENQNEDEESEEDWNLLNSFMEFGQLKIFRSVEPGLVHLWQDGCKEEDLGIMEKTLCKRLSMIDS